MKQKISPDKVEEDLEKLGYIMLSKQAKEQFQTAQHLLLITGALGTMLDLGILVLNW